MKAQTFTGSYLHCTLNLDLSSLVEQNVTKIFSHNGRESREIGQVSVLSNASNLFTDIRYRVHQS